MLRSDIDLFFGTSKANGTGAKPKAAVKGKGGCLDCQQKKKAKSSVSSYNQSG
jgi:hypothetical protein